MSGEQDNSLDDTFEQSASAEDGPQIGAFESSADNSAPEASTSSANPEAAPAPAAAEAPPAATNEAAEDAYDQSFEDASPAAAAGPAAVGPAASSIPAVQLDVAPADNVPPPAGDSLDAAIQEEIGASNSPQPSPSGRASPASPAKSPNGTARMGLGDDLKARTMFSMSTTDGVLKRTTFIHKISGYVTAPEITIASKGGSMFARTGQSPSPGTYNLPHDEKSKFKTTSRYSFGGGSRFGLGQSPTKLQPGPGAYNPRDPTLELDTKVGFGTSVRNKGSTSANPGPGAYENRSTVGGGIMCTARGRHVQSYMRSRSLPGPGAYSPTLAGAYQTSPKCGFGTSIRAGQYADGKPGPGTYEMQNNKCVGKDSAKYSATSRRKMHDLNSYVTPGPGTYNSHATSFGSPGAYSNRHVDEGYIQRAEMAKTQ